MTIERLKSILTPKKILAVAGANLVLDIVLLFARDINSNDFQSWGTVSATISIAGMTVCCIVLFNKDTDPNEMGLLSFNTLLLYLSSLTGFLLLML